MPPGKLPEGMDTRVARRTHGELQTHKRRADSRFRPLSADGLVFTRTNVYFSLFKILCRARRGSTSWANLVATAEGVCVCVIFAIKFPCVTFVIIFKKLVFLPCVTFPRSRCRSGATATSAGNPSPVRMNPSIGHRSWKCKIVCFIGSVTVCPYCCRPCMSCWCSTL